MKKYIKILAAGDEQKNHDCANAKGKGNLSSNTADLGSKAGGGHHMAHLSSWGDDSGKALWVCAVHTVRSQSPPVFSSNMTSWRMTKPARDYWVISHMHHKQHLGQHLGKEFPLQLAAAAFLALGFFPLQSTLTTHRGHWEILKPVPKTLF